MRPKSIALLMLALGCGLVASIGITQVIANQKKEPTDPNGPTQPVFVAMTDIGLGELLTPQDLKLEQWPKDNVPAGTISRLEDVEGRRTRSRLYAGDLILDQKLLGKGASQQGASALIPKNYRVVPVKVDLVSGGSSLILPGDRVDVMVHLFKDRNRGIPETVTRTILQDIKVFAVNDDIGLENDESGSTITAKTISLLVTPKQAAKLTLASQLGKIQLVMRGYDDDKEVVAVEATPSELLGTAGKSDREQESLAKDKETDKKHNGLLNLLGKMNKSLADGGAKTPDKMPSIWIMRVLNPGEVNEVRFEETEEEPGSTKPAWKVSTGDTGVSPGGAGVPPVSGKNTGKMPVPPPSKAMPVPPSEPQGPELNTHKNSE